MGKGVRADGGDVVTMQTKYSPEQMDAAERAASALRIAFLALMRVGLDEEALRVSAEHDRLISISGTRHERTAEQATPILTLL